MNRLLAPLLPALLLLFSTAALADQAVIPVDHFPPWKIVRDQQFSGIDIELVTALLREAGVSPRFFQCPWSRGLKMIETGEADILTGVLRRPEREAFMHFIDPPYKTRSNKAFYIRRDAPDIAVYEDLRGKCIGVQRGAKYFKRFDGDSTLVKQKIHTNRLNFKKLVAGRIDALVVTESLGDYLLAKLDLRKTITKASFRHDRKVPVHFAVSQRSWLMDRVGELEAAARRMRSSGEFERIIREFYERLGQ